MHMQKVGGHIGATNITITGTHSDVDFQVSATVIVDGSENEGERSEVTSESTVFVPNPSKQSVLGRGENACVELMSVVIIQDLFRNHWGGK